MLVILFPILEFIHVDVKKFSFIDKDHKCILTDDLSVMIVGSFDIFYLKDLSFVKRLIREWHKLTF